MAKRNKLKQQEWGIVVRMNNGGTLYYCLPTGRQAQEQWSNRENQALRFESQEAADALRRTFSTNAVALEYLVLPLTSLNA